MKIYCDLDGVVADFEGRYFEVTQHKLKNHEHKQTDIEWDLLLGLEPGYFRNLKVLPGSNKLIKMIESIDPKPKILTSYPKRYPHTANDKVWWCRNVLRLGSNWEIIPVPGSRLKRRHANWDHILIDDLSGNIRQWKADGGIAIHHKNMPDTLKLLSKYA